MSRVRRTLGIAVLVVALATACGSRIMLSSSAQASRSARSAAPAAVSSTAGAPTTVAPAPDLAVGELTPTRAAASAVAAAAPQPRVFTIATAGNGILYDIEPALRAALGTPEFFNHALGGFGISVLPDMWHGVFGNDIPSSNPDVVVVMLGQRDFPIAHADPTTYRAELDDAARLLSSKGARILWLGLPPQPPATLDDAGRRAVN